VVLQRVLRKKERENISTFEVMKAKGLGDTIEQFTRATGIKRVVDKVAKAVDKDCGCGERRDTLNRTFPYNK